jgi:aspartate kinase
MVTVLKIGGSVLSGSQGYSRAAAFVASRLCEHAGERLLVVVSAEFGATDALLASARDIVEEPDAAALDLLWSTGETRSAALVALHLHARGVKALALNVHQAGLVEPDSASLAGHAEVRTLGLRAALASHDVVVVPGFLARGAGDRIVSLGRGGSDLTAVLLAAGLDARCCELVKDVPGYFSRDPHLYADAEPLPTLDYTRALAMADEGCELVQRQALEAAARHHLPLVVRSIDRDGATFIR